jgi:hypothetical protein
MKTLCSSVSNSWPFSIICLTISMLSILDRFGRNPIWQSSNLLSTILDNLLFIKIVNILYITFNSEWFVSSYLLSYIQDKLFLLSILLVQSLLAIVSLLIYVSFVLILFHLVFQLCWYTVCFCGLVCSEFLYYLIYLMIGG